MIIYKKGDVLAALKNGDVDVLIHQTNCKGVMGSGIAKQIKEQFPVVYEAYKLQQQYQGLKLGEYSFAEVITQEFDPYCFKPEIRGLIINVNGQDAYVDRTKCNTNYAALGKALLDCSKIIPKHMIVSMPKIGAGLGGGDWKVIEAIIESVFQDRGIYVYEL